MKITLQMLEEKGACQPGKDWFKARFTEEGDYQEILNALASDKGIDTQRSWAGWLLQEFGKLDTVYEAESIESDYFFFAGEIKVTGHIKVTFSLLAGRDIKAGESIKAGWSIEAGGGIEAGRGIEAGWGIKAGESIKAGDGIEAGWSIKAGESIKAGDGHGIFAGIRARICDWELYAVVSAKVKPENLVSGFFRVLEN